MEGNVSDFNGTFPPVVILDLFSYLPFKELLRVSSVCSYWGELTADSSLYTEIELTEDDDVSTQQVLNLLEGKKHLKKLILEHRDDAADILERVSQNSQRLRHVSVTGMTFSSSVVTSLTDNCTMIRELRFFGCDLRGCNVSYFSHLKHLRSIGLAWCDVECREVVELVKGCPLLEELEIRDFSDAGIYRFDLPRIISSTSDSLKHLSVGFLGDEGLQQLCRKELRILHFSCTSDVTETSLRSLFSIKSLVWLCVFNIPNVSSSGWNNVFQTHQLLNLRHLDLCQTEGIENCHLKTIGESFPLLYYLRVAHCKITDEGIFFLMESIKPPLKFLLLEGNYIKGTCFSKIPENLPHLILLHVSLCYKLDTSLVSDLQARMPGLAVRWWDEEEIDNKSNARYQELRNHKELKGKNVSLKEVEELYKMEKKL